MAFLIRPPGQVKKAKAKLKPKSKNAQEILNRLQGFLNQNTSEPVEILCSFWEDQRNAITYKELREVVQSGMLTQKQFEDWQQDYSVLVEKKMAGVWMSAMAAGVAGQPMFDSLSFSINTQDPGIVSWIKDRGAEFVTSCTAEQKKAIQSLLVKKITDQHTVDELARFIRPCIGLTDGDTKAALKLYDTVKATLQTNHPRMKPENIRKKALDAAQKYAEQKHRQRAFTIAQTELEFAYNRGADQGVRQAQSQGLIGKTIKRWITSGDDSVCSICAALDGTEIEMDDNFDFKGRLLFAGQKMLPPAHPRCACAVEYIEVEPPVFRPENMTEIETEAGLEELKEFSSGEAAEEYFGKRPDRSLRRSNREEYDRQLDYFKTQSPYGKWSQQTTLQEEASITNYCGPDYSAINGLLRREMTENQVKLWDDLGNRKTSEMISDISSAISKFDLPEDIKVFRTCENDVLEKLQTKIGSTFHDDGFVSTSVVREKQASGNIFMEISVPKGQGVGAWVNPLSGKPEEYEFLLNRGTDFLVTDIGQDGADTIIRMKVTGRTETEWSYATKEEVIEQWKRRGVYSEESAKLL